MSPQYPLFADCETASSLDGCANGRRRRTNTSADRSCTATVEDDLWHLTWRSADSRPEVLAKRVGLQDEIPRTVMAMHGIMTALSDLHLAGLSR